MLKIRLQRTGRRNQPKFRVVVGDNRNGPKSGKFLEVLGFYNPKEGQVEMKNERINYWLEKGAQVSGTVHNFFIDKGIIKGKKKNVLPKKRPIVKEVPKESVKTETVPTEEVVKETEKREEPIEEISTEPIEIETAPTEEVKEESVEEISTESIKTETAPTEEVKEEPPEEVVEE